MESELVEAVRMEREAEKRLEECRRKVNELIGLVPESKQRKQKTMSAKDFLAAAIH